MIFGGFYLPEEGVSAASGQCGSFDCFNLKKLILNLLFSWEKKTEDVDTCCIHKPHLCLLLSFNPLHGGRKRFLCKKIVLFRLTIGLNCRTLSHFPKMHSNRRKCIICGCGKLVYNIIGQASNREKLSGYCKAFLDLISYLMPSLLSLNSSLQREESNDDMDSGQRLIILESVSSHMSQHVQADRVKSMTSAIIR